VRAAKAVKGVHSHTDRANEASRAYGDGNKFEFPLRRASGASSYTRARGGDEPWRTSRGERTRTQTDEGQNAKARKKLEQREEYFSRVRLLVYLFAISERINILRE